MFVLQFPENSSWLGRLITQYGDHWKYTAPWECNEEAGMAVRNDCATLAYPLPVHNLRFIDHHGNRIRQCQH